MSKTKTMTHEHLPLFLCRLHGKTALATSIIELQLTRPDLFTWQAGDYLWLGSEKIGFKPFSIANLANETHIHLHIARNAALNTWLDALQESSELCIKGPVRQYHWVDDCPMMMFAGGTGITPLLALLQAHQQHLTHQAVTLYWGVRQEEFLFARTQLNTLAQTYPNFQWHGVISESTESWSGLTGLLPDVIAQHHVPVTQHHLLICGPWPMVTQIKQWAMAQGATAAFIQ